MKGATAVGRRGLVFVKVIVAATLGACLLPIVSTSPASAAPPNCTSATPGGPVFVTETCVDPALSQPYTDVDQQRSSIDPATRVTVHYRYIHGGFTGTLAKFSLYFPAPSQYRGRFFE